MNQAKLDAARAELRKDEMHGISGERVRQVIRKEYPPNGLRMTQANVKAARAELRYWHNIAEEAQRNARACLREIMELRKDEK